MRVLILAGCSARKRFDANHPGLMKRLEDRGLRYPGTDLDNEDDYVRALRDYRRPASQMYLGSFGRIRDLAKALRHQGHRVKVLIVSARYGILNEDDMVIPYEANFSDMSARRRRGIAERLDISVNLRDALQKASYDWTVVILGETYLKAIIESTSKWNPFHYLKTHRLTIIGSGKAKELIGRSDAEHIRIVGIGHRNQVVKSLIQLA